jgi:ABC-type phosphate transport system substrate-binding protein
MRRVLIFIFIILVAPLSPGIGYPGEIAVIVNKDNSTDAVSFRDLSKIFRQEKQYWEDGKRIYLILQEAGSPEKEIVLQRLYKMKGEELKQFWLIKMFRGEITSFPKTFSSNEAVKRFVSEVPNAIGFIDASSADETVKVLRLDGKLPRDAGYVLSSR